MRSAAAASVTVNRAGASVSIAYQRGANNLGRGILRPLGAGRCQRRHDAPSRDYPTVAGRSEMTCPMISAALRSACCKKWA